MYAQFFGNYLLSKQAVTAEQLIQAIEEQHIRHIKVGLLAINAGLMTTEQVDHVLIRQIHENRHFGELAVEEGFLTAEQVNSLLKQQIPVYLLIGQRLVENGVLTDTELENLIADYQKENGLSQLESDSEQQENLEMLVQNLFLLTFQNVPEYLLQYLTLLFNNLIRFIGDDFMPLNPTMVTEYVTNYCAAQRINGDFSLSSYLDLEEDVAVAFASRYAKTTYYELNDYVPASMQDFLSLQNGLFSVNTSNEKSIELHLNPPADVNNAMISGTSQIILLPVIYPFGTVNFCFKIYSEN